jgi:hypothetical protein
MEVLEDLDRAAGGQPARAMDDVGLQRRADGRPPRRDRPLEVAGDDGGELLEAPVGVVEERTDDVGDRLALEAPADLARHLLVRRRADARELVVELGERGGRRRRDEVGHVADVRRRPEQVEQRVVEAAQPLACGPDPGEVQRAPRRVAQRVGAPGQVEERRDREARADEVLVAEAEADHGRQCLAPFG